MFRPIRTAEQITAEERAKVIKDMSILLSKGDTEHQILCKIYDAGYRKTDVQ